MSTTALTYATFSTPAGPFTVLADEAGSPRPVVHAAGFTDDPTRLATMLADAPSVAASETGLPDIAEAVADYFGGDLSAIDDVAVAYRPTGPFRVAAWDAMRAVKPGATVSYTQIAATAGNPSAVRAAGSACASNPIALFVPCHRVIRSDGSSHNYLYGLDCKAALLEHERAHGIGESRVA